MEKYNKYKNSGFFSNTGTGEKERIKMWLDSKDIKNYTINDDLTVDVNGEVNLQNNLDGDLEVHFGNVGFYFSITRTSVTSLKGCPKTIDGSLFCSYCPNLKTLEGGPVEVSGDCSCSNCKNLISLKGSPKKVGKNFYCYECTNLDTLEGCPEDVSKNFNCQNCKRKFSEDEIKELCKVGGEIKN